MAIKGGFYRSVLAQMIIAGFIALLGPGLWVSWPCWFNWFHYSH